MYRLVMSLLAVVVALTCPALSPAATPIDARSLSRWAPQPGWAPGREATAFGLEDADGRLGFWLEGSNSVMTWTLLPSPEELRDEPRYLVFTYTATGLATEGRSYLLLGKDGSPGWRQYLEGSDLVSDGQEHVLAVDLLSYLPPEPVSQFALRLGPPEGGRSHLNARIEFTNDLPPGIEPRTGPVPKPATIRLEVEGIEWRPSADWTPRPPSDHAMRSTDTGLSFSMSGARRSMRWSTAVPEGLDIAAMPYVNVRYRAHGSFGPYGYAVYMGGTDADGAKFSAYPLEPLDLESDGRWHVHRGRVEAKAPATAMAIGIDALSPDAEIEIDYIELSSHPPRTGIGDVLEYTPLPGSWPAGRDGLTPLPLPTERATPNHFMVQRLGIGSWFDAGHVMVEGIPFAVPGEPTGMFASGTVGEDDLAVDLPPETTEVFLLLAAAFPRSEFFGANWRKPAPLPMLTEPERMTIEMVHEDGTSDHMLPVHIAKSAYGVGHDVAAYAVHPAEGSRPTRLVLHDTMRNASFGIISVTVSTAARRVPEPETHPIWYPPVRKADLADASVSFSTEHGLAWDAITSPMLGGEVSVAGSPVFLMRIGEQEVPSTQWTVTDAHGTGNDMTITASYREGDRALDAVLRVTPEERNSARLALEVTNRGAAPVRGTLTFPFISGLSIGSVGDTWYFCARRGGVINRVPCAWRDEIGEAHPLQVDGFFNPQVGAGVAFMPRDLEEVFRWYRVEKNAEGGTWGLDFLPETVAPGAGWTCVPVVTAVIPGDWRDQFNAYLEWVRTWYKPTVARKQWFREVFAFAPGDPTSEMSRPVEERIDFVAKAQRLREAIGACDYVHLFGWAKTDQYGHWGDYSHYEAVGGRERFVEQVQRCRASGIPLGLYLDGYLVSTNASEVSPEQREAWAVRKADGEMLYHESYVAHSMCPYVTQWQDHLTSAYARVAEEVQPDGMYIDEFGKCMPARTCYSTEHGHPSPMGMSPGEGLLIRRIREALPERIATYSEFVPADVTAQYMDGAFGHVPLDGWRDGYDTVAPHYINLQRFAFPDFKTLQLIYYVPQVNGNWSLLKYAFFDGDGYYLTTACLRSDDHARGFYRHVFDIQHRYAAEFTSDDVEPLVPTEQPNLFANRFSTADRTVWTLFNAHPRTRRGHLLSVTHRPGAAYRDAWNDRDVEVTIRGNRAELSFDIGPRSVGCIVQE